MKYLVFMKAVNFYRKFRLRSLKYYPMKKILLLILMILPSCYQKEIHTSFKPSDGGAMEGTNLYFLAQAREYRLPKGISRFPDGGRARELRQVFGLYVTDTLSGSTGLLYRLPDIQRWPAGYSTRLEAKSGLVVFGIRELSPPSVTGTPAYAGNGIYLHTPATGVTGKITVTPALPTLANGGGAIAWFENDTLTTLERSTGQYSVFPVKANPAFIRWENPEYLLFYRRDTAQTLVFSFKDSELRTSQEPYLTHYGQAVKRSVILKAILDIDTVIHRSFSDMNDNKNSF
jgi:hypothetical protein